MYDNGKYLCQYYVGHCPLFEVYLIFMTLQKLVLFPPSGELCHTDIYVINFILVAPAWIELEPLEYWVSEMVYYPNIQKVRDSIRNNATNIRLELIIMPL
jgi:hypothetical protein